MSKDGLCAIVTGSASGLGAATAAILAKGGARIVVNYSNSKAEAEATADLCRKAGAEVVGQAGTSDEALELIDDVPIDAALLDGNLRGRPVDDIAAALTRRAIPFAFVTGYGRESLPRAFGNAAVLSKPFTRVQLLDTAVRLVEQPEGAIPLKGREGTPGLQ